MSYPYRLDRLACPASLDHARSGHRGGTRPFRLQTSHCTHPWRPCSPRQPASWSSNRPSSWAWSRRWRLGLLAPGHPRRIRPSRPRKRIHVTKSSSQSLSFGSWIQPNRRRLSKSENICARAHCPRSKSQPLRWRSMQRLPFAHLLFGFLPGDAIGFLDLPDELIALAIDHGDLVIAKRAPLFLDLSLELLPVPF